MKTKTYILLFMIAIAVIGGIEHTKTPSHTETDNVKKREFVAPEDIYLEYAVDAAKWINNTLYTTGGGFWIPIANSSNTTSSSYLTGMPGIATFIANLYAVTQDSRYKVLLDKITSELNAIKAENESGVLVYGWGDKISQGQYAEKYTYGSTAPYGVIEMYRSFDGSIGVGMFLLDIFERTHNYTYLQLALGIGNDIATEGYVPGSNAFNSPNDWAMIAEKYALSTRPDNQQDYVYYDYLRGVGGIGEF
ncbi:MAG: hypothetical protein QXL15_04600, partial [Candidatus Korarchaeota archaeon]